MKDNDIILIQEHWLQQIEIAWFDANLKGLQSYVISGMDPGALMTGRPFSGIKLWQKDLAMKVDILPTQSKRLTVVRLFLNDVSILSCNVYIYVM